MKSEGRFRILHADGFSLLLEVITGTTFFGFGQVFEREATGERYRLVNVGFLTPGDPRREAVVVAPLRNAGVLCEGEVLRAVTDEIWRPPLPD